MVFKFFELVELIKLAEFLKIVVPKTVMSESAPSKATASESTPSETAMPKAASPEATASKTTPPEATSTPKAHFLRFKCVGLGNGSRLRC